jgi:hypothetical protein
VLERLLKAHETWFDVSRNHQFAGRMFPGYAEFHSHGEQYVLVKRAKLWEVNTHEYLFFATEDRLDAAKLDSYVEFMKGDALSKVVLEPDHMSSFLSLVIVADSVDSDVEGIVRRTRYRKNFKWGLRGWADVRLAVIDITAKRVFTNPMGKELKATLEANLTEPSDKEMESEES